MKQATITLLKTLPEPYATQAIKNYDSSFDPYMAHMDNIRALLWAFDWHKSPQGHFYWLSLYNHLAHGQPLPPTIE